jgi:hypothetical protein
MNVSSYGAVVFLHVLCVIGMFSALAVEGVSLRKLARAKDAAEARTWAELWKLLVPLGMPALLGTLGTGVYLATTTHAWDFAWVELAMPALVLVAVDGAVVGPRRSRAAKSLETEGTILALNDPSSRRRGVSASRS